MLVLPDVFERTWGQRPAPFWPTATKRVRENSPEFCFMAEVYWDLEIVEASGSTEFRHLPSRRK